MVKRVSEDIAALASVAENEQRAAIHPAEQIAGFCTLAEQGTPPAQIGDAPGFSTRHVQRMLKLANLVPSLLEKLSQDELTVEQCQALCLEDDHARQAEILEMVKASWSNTSAHLLKRAITETELSTDSAKFRFIGREAYEAAGGYVREDLFSRDDGDGTADSVLVERLVQEKLKRIAQDIQQREGWIWSRGRTTRIWYHGDDGKEFVQPDEPAQVYTPEQCQCIDELREQLDDYDSRCDGTDVIEAEISAIQRAAEISAWTEDMKLGAGVVVSQYNGKAYIQRGVRLKADMPEDTGTGSTSVPFTSRQADAAERISDLLLTKMSSERTLAGQAETELAFHTTETVSNWGVRWSGSKLRQYDLEEMFWRWSGRFPSLVSMESGMMENQPFWTVMAETNALAWESHDSVRRLKRWMVPIKLKMRNWI